MSDHTITACCLNMEALLREAVGLLPAEPDWKVRVIAELNRPPQRPLHHRPAWGGAVQARIRPGVRQVRVSAVRLDRRRHRSSCGVHFCAALMGAARHELATAIAEGRATVEKHTFADGTTDVRIIWK